MGGGERRRREGGEEMGRKSTGDSGNSGSVFVGGRWDPPVESEERAKRGIKVEHGVKERDLCLWALFVGIELGPNTMAWRGMEL